MAAATTMAMNKAKKEAARSQGATFSTPAAAPRILPHESQPVAVAEPTGSLLSRKIVHSLSRTSFRTASKRGSHTKGAPRSSDGLGSSPRPIANPRPNDASAIRPFSFSASSGSPLDEESTKAAIKAMTAAQGWVIDPRNSRYMPMWDMVMLVALLFVAFVTPYEVTFMEELGIDELDMLFYVNRAVDLCFLVDM
eukprot:5892037-Prymnesium_polylepis.1